MTTQAATRAGTAVSTKLFDCVWCESKHYDPYATIDDWGYVSCEECGSISLYPYPEPEVIGKALDTVHGVEREGSSWHLRDTEIGQELWNSTTSKTWNDLDMDSLDKDMNVLDVGCGDGAFLAWLEDIGITGRLCGVEISSSYEPLPGMNVVRANFNAGNPHGQGFDLVTMFDVLEHTPTPSTMLRRVWQTLKYNGLMLLQLPIVGEVAKAYGENWRRLTPPDHLSLPTFSTLKNFLYLHGFRVERHVTWGSGMSYGVDPIHKGAWDKISKDHDLGDEVSLIARKW